MSAGYQVAAHCDKIVLEDKMSQVGSIGVFAKFQDFEAYQEKNGLKTITVYAPQSSDKNSAYENALKGDFKVLQNDVLKPIADNFINTVRKARPQVSEETFTGKTYFSSDAIKLGLADSVDTIENVIAQITGNQKKNKPQNNPSMKRNQIAALVTVLGIAELLSQNDKFYLSAEQVEAIENKFAATNVKMSKRNLTFGDDGGIVLNAETLLEMNAQLTDAIVAHNSSLQSSNELAKAKKEHFEQIAQQKKEYEAKIAQLSDLPENISKKDVHKLNKKGFFDAPTTGLNQADSSRPWNKAAVAIANGDRRQAAIIMTSEMSHHAIEVLQNELKIHGSQQMNLDQMKSVLGNSFVEPITDVHDMLVENAAIDKIFPIRSSGIKDELPSLSIFIDNFLQPRNSEWAEKGGFEIQANKIKVKNSQVSKRFSANDMWAFIESWLAEKTQGTDPFQEGLVQWLVKKMLRQIMLVERPLNAIRGVYITPEAGVAGASLNSMDGVIKSIQNEIKQNKILVTRNGKPSYFHMTNAGDPNLNHLYYKIQGVIKSIPQNLRDAFSWEVLISKNDKREYNLFLEKVVASNPNFTAIKNAESFDNFNIVDVPHWQDGLIVITLPKNIVQAFREKNDDNRIYFDREKRDTIVFMDMGYVVGPVFSGKIFDTIEELKAAKGNFQRLFTNGEFNAYTPITIKPDITAPTVAIHNVLKTSTNTITTTITTIADATIGEEIFITGDGETANASKILDTNTNFIGLDTDIVFEKGLTAKFRCTATDKFTLEALYQDNALSAISFDANDVTPDVSDGILFITSLENSSAKNITDLEGAQIGVPVTILGSGGGNATTINKTGKFKHITASWTATKGTSITLVKRADGLFVQTI